MDAKDSYWIHGNVWGREVSMVAMAMQPVYFSFLNSSDTLQIGDRSVRATYFQCSVVAD
jgi:hypothetical protein